MPGTKKVPTYWLDLEGDEVIVESDCKKFPVVARFPYDPNIGGEPTGIFKLLGLSGKVGCAVKAVEQAEEYIQELNSGRVTPTAC